MTSVRVEKVWGHEEWLENNDRYCVKLLHVRAGYRCSMHHHPVKDETFYVQSGSILLELSASDPLGCEVRLLQPGDHARLLPGTWHRFTGLTNAVIVEAGTTHSDDDVVRLTSSERVP